MIDSDRSAHASGGDGYIGTRHHPQGDDWTKAGGGRLARGASFEGPVLVRMVWRAKRQLTCLPSHIQEKLKTKLAARKAKL